MILRLTMILLAFTVVFASCKKDEAVTVDKKYEATYNGKTYSYTQAFHETYGGPYQSIALASSGFTFDANQAEYNGTGDMLNLNFLLAIGSEFGGTYTFDASGENENTLMSVQLISDASSLIISSDNTTTGNAVITKTGETYEVTCTITIAGKELKGYYKGTLQDANFFMPGK